MKNSPEHVLKKMYTGIGRTWKNVSFNHTNTFGPNYIIPDMVMALTGNTTVKMKVNSYILSQPTPNPIFDNMRVDVSVFFSPQRLYTRGLIGDNFIETTPIEDFPIPIVTIRRDNIPQAPTNSPVYTADDAGNFSYDRGFNLDTTTAETMLYRAVLPGSLLHRLGWPMFMMSRGFVRGIYDSNLSEGGPEGNMWTLNLGTNAAYPKVGKNEVSFGMSTVCAYYDICRYFLSNLMTDEVPVVAGSSTSRPNVVLFGKKNGQFVNTGLPVDVTPSFYSLASFGTFLNEVRGVTSVIGSGNATVRPWNNLFYRPFNNVYSVCFNDIPLMDLVSGVYTDSNNTSWRNLGTLLKNKISSTGLWPTRYDSHFQTMYFDASKVNNLMSVVWNNNVESFRSAESEFATKLKRILRGMRWGSWVDVTFGARVKMDDHPIMLGKDSYYLRFQDIVNTGSQTEEIPLGASVGRGVGGNKTALREKEDDVKSYVFTTQEPGYLFVMYSVVPTVSYANVLPRHLTFKKMGDFALPQNSGKQFESLRVSDFMCTLTDYDDYTVGSQPIYFDNMTSFNKVGGAFATDLRTGYVFRRDFGGFDVSQPQDVGYFGTTYVEPGAFDGNFEDQGVNGRQIFNVKTYYDINVCVPLEDQVTDYNI